MKKVKFIKFIFVIVQVICLILMVANNVYANMNDIYKQPNQNPFNNSVSIVIGIIQAVGMSVAVIMLTIIGIKYIMASPEGKADLKQQLFPYLIGCILLFGGSWLIGTIADFAYDNIK